MRHLELCLEAIANMDSANLESRLLSASVALGQRAFLENILQPLLLQTGEMWSDGRLKVAHEHLASAVIRSLLGSMYVTARSGRTGPLLLSTTPSGQWHEFGALMASVTAASIGWRTTYLGPNLPAEDIAAAVEQHDTRAVALSVVYPPDDPRLSLELQKLARMLPAKTALLVGGRAAPNYQAVLSEIGASLVGGLSDLRVKLDRLRENPGNLRVG
jgi:methanogenic corrinoid protein MtbC1